MSSHPLRVSEYEVGGLLGEGAMSYVYAGVNVKSRQAVAIKILKPKISSSRMEDLIRFQREAQAVSKLRHPNLLKIYEAGRQEEVSYLVMEPAEGQSLAEYLAAGGRRAVPLQEALHIIAQIAECLEYVHSQNIIHRDLKPGNIMVCNVGANPGNRPDPITIKLVDFGLAEVMELEQIKEAAAIVGTFSYMSPEQSGIIRKPVDERSDLYSLGIIFYEMLAGELPFVGETIGAIIHQQVAKKPKLPEKVKAQVPGVIEDIILRLLSKEPEERYQSARGLLADLKKVSAGESEFVLGREDRQRKLLFRTRLIGREAELEKLQKQYEEANQGRGSICLIGGEAGRGKSRLVSELRSYVFGQGGKFIEGRCYSQENKMPYQAFSEAITGYLSQRQKTTKAEQKESLARMKESLGELGEIICRMNPLLREVLGEVPKLVALDPERENRRFLMVAGRFFENLGEVGRPLVMFLDDLHWSDEGSLSLLQEIQSEIKDKPLLIIGAYRDNEINSEHTLNKVIRECEVIKLENFDEGKLNKMIAELLLSEEEESKELAKYVQSKSHGNPFFALEIMRHLADEKVLANKDNHWAVDWEKTKELSVPVTMLEMLVARTQELPRELEELLTTAAVIGRTFKIELLYKIMEPVGANPCIRPDPDSVGATGRSPVQMQCKEKITNLVDEAIDLQLLERSPDRQDVLFCHDRIRDAFFGKVDAAEKKRLHLTIAGTLEGMHKDHPDPVLFDLAHHYIEAGEEDKALQYALPAARKAKEGYANEEAIRYYKTALKVLEEQRKTDAPEYVQAKEGLTEIYLIVGLYDEAIKMAQEVLLMKHDNIEKSRIYERVGDAFWKKGDFQECENHLIKALDLLGERFPKSKPALILSILREVNVHFLHCMFPWLFVRRDSRKAKIADREIVERCYRLAWVTGFTDVNKFIYCVFRMTNISRARIGESRQLAVAAGILGAFYMFLPLFKKSERRHAQAVAIKEKLHDELGLAQECQMWGFVISMSGQQRRAYDMFYRGWEKARQIGDLWELAMNDNGLGHCRRYVGEYEKAIEHYSQYLHLSRRIGDNGGISSALAALAYCHREKGDLKTAQEYAEQSLALSERHKLWFYHCYGRTAMACIQMDKGNFKAAIEHLERAKSLFEEAQFIPEYTIHCYSYLAEARVKLARQKREAGTLTGRDIRQTKHACRRALSKNRSWPNHYAVGLRAQAGYCFLTGRRRRAERWFNKSIAHAVKYGRRFEEAKSLYDYGVFLDKLGRSQRAREVLQKSHNLAKEIGAKAYVERTGKLLGLERKAETTTQERLAQGLELQSVIKVGHLLSSILDLDELLEKIMDAAIEVTGAERGILFLYPEKPEPGQELQIKASRNIEQGSYGQEEFSVSRTVVKEVAEKQESRLVVDAGAEEGLKGQASVVREGLRSIMCVPLMLREKILGVLYLDNRLAGGVFTEEKLEVLRTLSAQAGISIENARLYKEVQEKARMEEELKLGQEIQKGLLPGKSEEYGSLKVCGLMQPAREIGGDYYDYWQTGGKTKVVIGDVSGKGVGAGLITAAAKATMRSVGDEGSGAKETLVKANRVLYEYMRNEKIMTMLCVEWDGQDSLKYSSAGHEAMLVVRSGVVEEVEAQGVMLGIVPEIGDKISEGRIKLRAGDKVILYTDGAIDARNQENKSFSQEELVRAVAKYSEEPIEELLNSVKEEIMAHVGEKELFDDVTLVGLEAR